MDTSSRSSGDTVVSSKSESLHRALSDVDFDNKTILDAGTGVWSASFLARRAPEKIVGVVGPEDTRKEEEARNAFQSIVDLIDESINPQADHESHLRVPRHPWSPLSLPPY